MKKLLFFLALILLIFNFACSKPAISNSNGDSNFAANSITQNSANSEAKEREKQELIEDQKKVKAELDELKKKIDDAKVESEDLKKQVDKTGKEINAAQKKIEASKP